MHQRPGLVHRRFGEGNAKADGHEGNAFPVAPATVIKFLHCSNAFSGVKNFPGFVPAGGGFAFSFLAIGKFIAVFQ